MPCSSSLSSKRTLRLLPALVTLFALGSAPRAQRAVKLATLVPEGSLWDKAIRRMGAEWKRSTDGRVVLRVYPGGVAGDEPDLIRKMRIGQLHAASLTSSGLGDLDPALRIFEVPLFFRSDAEVRYVLEKMGAIFAARLESRGFVLIHWGHAGWLHFFSREPIGSYDDFRAMKQFVWGETRMAEWYAERGVRTVPLAATDVLTGLQTGLIDVLPVTPLAALSLQWFRSAPHMFDHRIAPLIGATIITARAWKRFSVEDRRAILDAGGETGDALFEALPGQEQLALVEMEKRGLTITRMADEADERRWKGLAEHFHEKLRTSSVPPEIFRDVGRHLEEFRQEHGEEDG